MGESMHLEMLPWYAAGSVSPEEATEIAAHLETCESCRKELEDLRSLGATLQAAAALAPEEFDPEEQRASWFRDTGIPTWLLAAAMLVVGLAVGIVGSRFVDEPAQGQAFRPIEVVMLTPATRGSDGVKELLGDGPWALRILLPGAASPGQYDVWLEGEDGSRAVDSTIVVDANMTGSIGFHLERLPAGIYVVVLRGQETEARRTYRYALRISPPPD